MSALSSYPWTCMLKLHWIFACILGEESNNMQILQSPDTVSYRLVTISSTLRAGPVWPVLLLPPLHCIYKASVCWQLYSFLLILSVTDGFQECTWEKTLDQLVDLAVLFRVLVSSPIPNLISSQVSLFLNGFWPCLPLSLLRQPARSCSQALSCCPCLWDPCPWIKPWLALEPCWLRLFGFPVFFGWVHLGRPGAWPHLAMTAAQSNASNPCSAQPSKETWSPKYQSQWKKTNPQTKTHPVLINVSLISQ